MLSVLRHPTYRALFGAQVLSLVGSGLMTVALALLAYDLARGDAGLVLGTALAIKMIAYVTIAPIAGAFAERLPRRALLVGLDLARAGFVLLLPFVTAVWQVYVLVFLLQACSAGFTPTFQATIPDVLTEERDYAAALSLSRLAYDLESLLSPVLAGALLAVVAFDDLFLGTVLGFLASAALVLATPLPRSKGREGARVAERLTRGVRIYLATPRLRGLLGLSAAVASGGAMVIVNTVVYVREILSGTNQDVAIMLAAFGLGSMAVALAMPRVLERLAPRSVMLTGAALLSVATLTAALLPPMGIALMLWTALGAGTSMVLTPTGLILRRSCQVADRPALFAGQFALSHTCWLVTYPLAGVLGARLGLSPAFAVLALCAFAGTLIARATWPRHDPQVLTHEHEALVHAHGTEHDRAHRPAQRLAGSAHRHARMIHAHPFVIDEHHPRWPSSAG